MEISAQAPEKLDGLVTIVTRKATAYIPLAELVDAMIAGYNKLKGTDTHLSRKRLLSDKTMCYVNGFLLISVVA